MSVHRNAALSLVKRRELVDVVAAGSTLKAAAAAFNVGGNTVRRWWRRYRVLGPAGLEDRSSRPKHMPRAISKELRQEAIRLRRERRTVRAIAFELGISKTSVARIVKAAGLSRLRALDPPEPDNRYEEPAGGALIGNVELGWDGAGDVRGRVRRSRQPDIARQGRRGHDMDI